MTKEKLFNLLDIKKEDSSLRGYTNNWIWYNEETISPRIEFTIPHSWNAYVISTPSTSSHYTWLDDNWVLENE